MDTFLTVHGLCIWLFFTVFLILSRPTLISATTTTTTVKSGRLVAELIHRDSPLSPFYDPSITIYDRDKWALQSSIKRHAYLNGNQRNASTDAVRGEVIPDSTANEYLAKLSIGTPPVEAYFIIDTGSDLLWTQCQPCLECYKQPGPIYDPSKSSTYSSVPCDSSYCTSLRGPRGCRRPNRCIYMYEYADGSYSNGTLVYDSLKFRSSDGTVATITNVAFGCGNKNKNILPGGEAGLLGLSASGTSLISQLSPATQSKFSYCFGNISNVNAKGHLVLGEGAFIDGYTTPLTIGSNGLYYLTLEAISVGDKKLDIKPGTFDLKPNGRGGLIIDSGTSYTLLSNDAYNKLRYALNQEMILFERDEVPDPVQGHRLCFDGVATRDLTGFPTVTFHFKGEVDVVLERWSIFLQANQDVFCAAFLPVSADSYSILGNLAQQFYNVGYDLVNKEVSFEIIDCSVF